MNKLIITFNEAMFIACVIAMGIGFLVYNDINMIINYGFLSIMALMILISKNNRINS